MSKVIPNVGDVLTNEHYLPCASVVMAQSDTGTAYQKFFSDSSFHSAGNSSVRSQGYLVEKHSVVIYVAPLTDEEQDEIDAERIISLSAKIQNRTVASISDNGYNLGDLADDMERFYKYISGEK